ncbi:MAG: VOC family protein [Deltaproteobacteria bacterium]|nr:VOC family protein [Deltaproteobacteria bacterium]
MSKLTQFRSWNFNADDLEQTVSFYQDVLGATVRKKHKVAGVDVVRLNLGNAVLGVFDASKDRHPRVPHHTFEIDARGEPEDFVKEIEARGAKVSEIRRHDDGKGYSVYVVDPSGNRLELSTSSG